MRIENMYFKIHNQNTTIPEGLKYDFTKVLVHRYVSDVENFLLSFMILFHGLWHLCWRCHPAFSGFCVHYCLSQYETTAESKIKTRRSNGKCTRYYAGQTTPPTRGLREQLGLVTIVCIPPRIAPRVTLPQSYLVTWLSERLQGRKKLWSYIPEKIVCGKADKSYLWVRGHVGYSG